MKNKLTIVAVIIVSVVFFMVSCKKDKLTEENTNMIKDNSYTAVIQRIEYFKQRMEGNYKNGTLMPLDTAVWNLEALLTNYGGYPDSVAEVYLLMHARFTLTVDANNMVTNNDVQALYQQMVDTITAQLNGMAGNVKFLHFSDVQQDSVIGNTAYLSTNNGYGTGHISGSYPPFDDDWIWGTVGTPPPGPFTGNCSHTNFSSDGSNEIQYRLNHQAISPIPVLYTDIETKEMTGWDFEDENGNPRLYIGTDINHCMTINELTNNLTNADDIIYSYVPVGLRPVGKVFMNAKIHDIIIVPSDDELFLHNYKITYGIPYTNPQE